MFAPVYLDCNATTPLDERVMEAMLPYFTRLPGNASSRHDYGRAARDAIDRARLQVAAALGAHPTEIIFTSGGSEANNLFIKGAAACLKPARIAVSAIEHPCVREPARELVRLGWTLDEIGVDADGRIDLADVDRVVAAAPALMSVMMANNETGVIQDVGQVAECARRARAWLHSDAVQAFGKIPLDFRALNARGLHAMTVSAHKIGGPKGVGALVVDKRVELRPLIAGGGHERGLRSGTENVPAIVGFGRACELAVERMDEVAARQRRLRDDLDAGIARLGGTVFGAAAERLPNTTYCALPGIDGETLVGRLDRAGYAVASGAACSSTQTGPSHVLLAMGVAPELARGAVRISLGVATRDTDIEGFLAALAETLRQLRGLAAMAA